VLATGARLGRYEIRAHIGAGGMGEVYLARDPTIGRDVAIKVLRSAFSGDPDRLARFEQEAQAVGALNHPNILSIYDVAACDGSPYVVCELLEGETLRERMGGTALPVRKAVEYAVQIARGLAAAHAKGIVHRDLKPENVFVTRDGRVKILDFGLAKLIEPERGAQQTFIPTGRVNTDPGMVMGTVGFMAPEQLRGQTVDHRADIFAFGAVLYEMVAGKPAFHRGTAADILSAILKDDPPGLSVTNQDVPPALERIVNHCLEKSPEDRFQSMRDLGFDLESISGSGQSALMLPTTVVLTKRRRWLVLAIGLPLVAVALFGGGLLLGRETPRMSVPSYRLLTFHRGGVLNARFAPDGQTIMYTAAVGGKPSDIFSRRTGNSESRALGLANAVVLAVSSTAEMAVLLNRQYLGANTNRGTLARLPLIGGAPREILEDVQEADWSPDGTQLAIVRWVNGRNRLEYPIGKVLYETSGYLAYPRVSPTGALVAFMDHQFKYDNRGWVAVVDRNGNKKTLTREWDGENGLAWSPGGDEIWYTAGRVDEFDSLHAVTLAGRDRLIARAPGYLEIEDIARDGSVLMTRDDSRTDIIGLAPDEAQERDLSWFNDVALRNVSADGRTLLFTNFVVGTETNYSTYLGKTDGSPPVRLGDGDGDSVSPDGKWVLALLRKPPTLFLLPTGAGELKHLDISGMESFDRPLTWFPNGKQILFVGREPGHGWRSYIYDLDGGVSRPATQERVIALRVSPDGKSFVASAPDEQKYLYSVAGGAARPVPGLTDREDVAGWSADGNALWVYRRGEIPFKVFRLNLATGRKELWRNVAISDTTGARRSQLFMTPDGKSYVYGLSRSLSDLYLVEGLR